MKKVINIIIIWNLIQLVIATLIAYVIKINVENYVLKTILILLAIIIFTITIIGGIVLVMTLIKNAGKNDAIEKNLSKIDFGKYKDYYRDILKKYNIVQLSYIDNYKIDKNTIAAALLDLERKKIIKITNNTITINNAKKENLDLIEKHLIANIKDNKIHINVKKLTRLVKKESQALLIKNKQKKISAFDYFKFFFTIALIIEIAKKSDLIIIIFAPLVFICCLGPILFSLYADEFNENKPSHIRNELGEEINLKLEGLKNYINDFSILNEREKEELNLWDMYLIYAILFNINKPAYEELEQFIELKK